MSKSNKRRAKIGFGLPWPQEHARDATGYCAAEMAIEAENKKGDLPFELELVLVNDERDPERARVVAKEFTEDPDAVGIIGPLNSPMCDVSQDIYHKAGIAQLSSEASSPVLTQRGYDNFFRLVANDEYYGKMQARVAVEYLKAKRIAILSDNTVWGAPIADVFSTQAEQSGAEIVLYHKFSDDERNLNFDGMVNAVRSCSTDLIFFAVYWNPAHIIAHQLRYNGVKTPFLGTDALKSYPYLEVPGLDEVPPYQTFPGADMRIQESARDFFAEFAHRYPRSLVNIQYAPEGYDCVGIFAQALRRAQRIDRSLVLHEIQSMDEYQGISGTVRFDEKGDIVDPPIGLYRCEDGLRNYVGSLEDLLTD